MPKETTSRFYDPVFINTLIEKLKRSLRIAVIYGGDRHQEGAVISTTYNPRSDKNYFAVAIDISQSLQRLGFEKVHLIPEDIRLFSTLQELNIELAWVNSGGTQGFSSICHAPSMLELCGIPYIGHNPLNAALLDNKHCFKYMLKGLGIATPEFVVCDFKNEFQQAQFTSQFDSFFSEFSDLIVKPVSGRASLNVFRTQGRQETMKVAREVFEVTGNLVLIERYISGEEFTIAVNGPVVSRNRKIDVLDSPLAFSACLRLLGVDEPIFTSMDIKPIGPDRCHLLDPQVDIEKFDELEHIAQKVHWACSLETLVRVDIRADQNGRLFVLEANPKPDLKQPSGHQFSFVASGLHLLGMDYDDLILSIFMDRFNFLMMHRPHTVAMITE